MRTCSHTLISDLSLVSSIVVLAIIQAVELKCAGIESPFDILPRGDHFVKYGTSLNLYCKLNMSHPNATGHTSKDLYFYTYREGSKLLADVEIVNETTIATTLKDLPLQSQFYYCSLSGKATCFTNVEVGYEPKEVTDFRCRSYNWEKLVCRWTPPTTYIKTVYRLKYSLKGRAGRIPNSCPNDLDVTNNTCIFTHDTTPPYRQPHEYFKFELTGTNPLGNSTTTINFHHFAYVVPNKPEDVTVVNKTLGSAFINWTVPYPMYNFPPGLKSKIEFKSKWDPPDKWNVIYLEREAGSKNKAHLYNLTGLEYAHTPYDVRIYLKSSKAKDGDSFWSEPGTVTFVTPSTIPGKAPKTTFGSFDVVSRGNDTDVFVYWNRIPEYMENGEDFSYNVTCLMNNKYICDPPIEKTLTYAKFAIRDYNEYTFTIYSVNKMGSSRDSSRVFVPKFRSIPRPESFTKVAYENGVHELSWKPVHHEDLSNYTIFWCEDNRDLPVPCKGVVDWIEVGKNVTEKNITMKSVTKFYKFAIAANLVDGTSSGMIWSSCVIFHDKVLKIVDDVRIAKVDSREADVVWEIRCAQSSSFGGFTLYYCPVSTRDDDCQDDQPEQIVIVRESERRNVTLANLKPYTTYKLQMSIISYDGARQKQFGPRSAPKRFTTLEDAPSEPLHLSVVNVTNSSATLTWTVPRETNGILQIYKLYLESDSPRVERTIRFEAKSSEDDSLVTEHVVAGLLSHTTYKMALKACTSQFKCSGSSTPVAVMTRIGIPRKMMRPQIISGNNTVVDVTWEPPFNATGSSNYYELCVSVNGSHDRYINFTGIRGEIHLPDCSIGGNPAFKIRAINVDENIVYEGPWSEPTWYHCGASAWTRYMTLFAWISGICAFSVMSSVLFYIVKRGWLQCRKMKDVEVKLPPGLQSQDLDKDNQDYMHLERWPPRSGDAMQGSLVPGLAPDEESLLGKKSDESLDHMTPFNMVAKSSGDSSGCSVGRESMSSSVASENHGSSDSGAEADQCLSTSLGTAFDEWDALKTQPKNIKEPVKSARRIHNELSIADDRLNFSALNDWAPVDSTSAGYTKVGFTDGAIFDKSLPGKGYVTIASITPQGPPPKDKNQNSDCNSSPLDNIAQFLSQESDTCDNDDRNTQRNSQSVASPCYVTLACLQEQKVDDSTTSSTSTNHETCGGENSDTAQQNVSEAAEGKDLSGPAKENRFRSEGESETAFSNNASQMPPYVSMMENPHSFVNEEEEEDEEAEAEAEAEEEEEKQDEEEFGKEQSNEIEDSRRRLSPSIDISNKKTVSQIHSDLVDKLSKDSESYSKYIPHRVFGKESVHTQ